MYESPNPLRTMLARNQREVEESMDKANYGEPTVQWVPAAVNAGVTTHPDVWVNGIRYAPADDLKNARWALRSAVNRISPPLTGESAIEKFIMDENSKVELEPIVRTEL